VQPNLAKPSRRMTAPVNQSEREKADGNSLQRFDFVYFSCF
jgi:hypothetical protein